MTFGNFDIDITYSEVMLMLTRLQIVLGSKDLTDKDARKYALEDVIDLKNELYDFYCKEYFKKKKEVNNG